MPSRSGRSSDPPGTTQASATIPKHKKLSYNETRELERLPSTIEALEGEQTALNSEIAAPNFYKAGADAIARTLARLDELQATLATAYARWDELDSRAQSQQK